MYKVTLYYADGSTKAELKEWRFCPEARDLDSWVKDNVVAYKVERA